MKTAFRCITYCLTVACLGFEAVPAMPAGHDGFPRPLPVSNQSPVVGVFGIPRAQGTQIPGAGGWQWDATLDLTSHFEYAESDSEAVFFDGETTRFALQGHYGIDDRWSLGLEVPWVHHGGGFLDGFIIDWHDFWGFPQRGRDEVARDEIRFRYDRDGTARIDIDDAGGGLGDIIVSAHRRLWRSPDSAAVLHTQVKLPTGDPDELTGSGAADASAGVEMSRRWERDWHSTLRAGVVYLGKGDILPELQRDWAAYGGFDLVWRPFRAIALRVQFDARTEIYHDSELDHLSEWSGMLTVGGTWYINRDVALDLAVVENVPNTDVVSDVTFQLRLRTALNGSP